MQAVLGAKRGGNSDSRCNIFRFTPTGTSEPSKYHETLFNSVFRTFHLLRPSSHMSLSPITRASQRAPLCPVRSLLAMINNRYRSLGLYFCAWAAARPALALLTTGVRCPVSALATPVMVVGTDKQAVHLPSGRFTACWPVGLGQYNGGPAVFLASKRRILDPREEVFPIPISDEVVSLLSEASEWVIRLAFSILYPTCFMGLA